MFSSILNSTAVPPGRGVPILVFTAKLTMADVTRDWFDGKESLDIDIILEHMFLGFDVRSTMERAIVLVANTPDFFKNKEFVERENGGEDDKIRHTTTVARRPRTRNSAMFSYVKQCRSRTRFSP